MSSPSAALFDALTGPLAELGVDLEDVSVSKAGRRHVVRVVIDKDGGVDLDTVAQASQAVSAVLDEQAHADLLPGPFVLEVTSPGVDRPLTEARHWRRALSRLVKVTTTDGASVEGRVLGVPTDDEIVLATGAGEVTISRADVAAAVMQVEFNRKDAEKADGEDVPTDDEGADDAEGERGE